MNQKVDIPTVSNYPVAHWHFEVSSKCTLKCPRCPRTEKQGMYKVTEHSLEFVQSILTPEVLATTPNILFCGGQGDPIYCHDFIDILRYIKTTNPRVRIAITTNGSHKKPEWWTEMGTILNAFDTVTFSVDGWDNASNNLYRVNSNYDSIVAGIRALRKANNDIHIMWNSILFRFNQDNVKTMCDAAKNAGANVFTLVRSTLFGSNVHIYIDSDLGYDPLEPSLISEWDYRDTELNVELSPSGRIYNDTTKRLVKNFANVIEEYKQSPIVPLCLSGDRGLYVDAEGILYPCSWISHPFGIRKSKSRDKIISWEKSLFVEHKSNFDLHQHSLAEILDSDLWKKLMASWRDPEKMFIECESKCSNAASCSRYHKKEVNNALMTYEDFSHKFSKNIG